MKYASLIFSVLMFSGFANAAELSANSFECTGDGVKIGYTSSSFAGQPTYQVVDGAKEINFSGKDIQRMQSPMGLLVTANYDRPMLADGPQIRYTLVVPANTIKVGDSLKIETQLLKTTVASLFRPYNTNLQLQHTEVIPVSCDAALVYFLN